MVAHYNILILRSFLFSNTLIQMNTKYTLLLAFLISFSSLFAQVEPEINPVKEIKDTSINGQFETLYKKSNNYQDYKVVERTSILKLKKNAVDSLNALKTIITQNQNLINEQKKEINVLNNNLASTKTSLNTVTQEKDAIQFFGAPFTKDTYKLIMWCIVGGLLVFLLFFIYKYQSSLKGTKEAIGNLNDLETEFEDHRRRALEREQIINRKLQDELNKQKA